MATLCFLAAATAVALSTPSRTAQQCSSVAVQQGFSRRYVGRLAALMAATPCMVPRRSRAVVDGIPLYAPMSGTLNGGIGSGFPDKGFETLLPQVEAIRDWLPALAEAIESGDWARVTAALSGTALANQAETLGSMAAILGDEAYTVLGFKGQYMAAAKRIAQTAAKGASGGDAGVETALGELKTLRLSISGIIDLVPPVIVEKVRAYERRNGIVKSAAETAERAEGAERPASPESPESPDSTESTS
eukprot:CAMPEP_0183341164 /NCGR_PEP_ID=MMETSP0164_2-20130417/7452_1 /TAXON_ID=221442 /ORGANISM="Coccolithus pelagicus ssp braarudi, Strain PLY182g" /LENGTH=246 /DNA_ID=CAMNT_0025511399 /DNA_START=13 /DNA_END=753 /DNA_ORIENTATION=+